MSNFWSKNSALNLYLPLVPASLVIDEILTFILLAVLLLINPTYYQMDDGSRYRYWCKVIFLVILAYLSIIILNGIFVVGTDPWLIIDKGHRNFILLLLAPVFFDYFYCTAKEARFDPLRIFRNYHLALFLFTSIAVLFILAGWSDGPSNISSLRDVIGPMHGIFEGNPNHRDDYAMILILVSVWSAMFVVLKHSVREKWPYLIIPLAVGTFFFNAVIYSGNRGGWIGLVLATGFLLLFLVWIRQFKLIAVSAIVFVVFAGVYFGELEKGFSEHWSNIANGLRAERSLGSKNPETDLKEFDLANRCLDGNAEASDFSMIPEKNTYLRVQMYPFSMKAWMARPLLGYGVYDRDYLTARFSTEDRCVGILMSHPHNIILHQAIIGGIFMVLMVVGMILMPVYWLVGGVRRNLRYGLLLLPMAFYSIYLLTENMFNRSLGSMEFGAPSTFILFTAASMVISRYQ